MIELIIAAVFALVTVVALVAIIEWLSDQFSGLDGRD